MPAASVEVRRAAPEDRQPLARMLELYQHDLSDLWDQDLDAHGEYGYPLDRYRHGDLSCLNDAAVQQSESQESR